MDKIQHNSPNFQHYSDDGVDCPPQPHERQAQRAAAGGSADRLEPRHNNLTRQRLDEILAEGLIVALPVRCRSRACPSCGRAAGIKTRERLREKVGAGLFSQPALMTLTVDRKNWQSPQGAYRAVTAQALIPRLMRRLGVRAWVWTLEFQTRTGEGWPHWHILLDQAHCGGRLDYRKLWHLWRDVWGVGGCDVSQKHKAAAADPLHAVNYITKYLTKGAGPWPTWWLEGSRNRVVGASRAVGRLVTDDDAGGATDEPGEDRAREIRPTWQRVRDCRQSVNLFAFRHDSKVGQASRVDAGEAAAVEDSSSSATSSAAAKPAGNSTRPEWIASIPMGYDDLCDWTLRTTGGRMGYRGILSMVAFQGERAGRPVEITTPGFTDAGAVLNILGLSADTDYRRAHAAVLDARAELIKGQWVKRATPPLPTRATTGKISGIKPPTAEQVRTWWSNDRTRRATAEPQGTHAKPPSVGPDFCQPQKLAGADNFGGTSGMGGTCRPLPGLLPFASAGAAL
jgi:hypothetical protein